MVTLTVGRLLAIVVFVLCYGLFVGYLLGKGYRPAR